MKKAAFLFGDIVVVDDDQIGVVVKAWHSSTRERDTYVYEVYVRSFGGIKTYEEDEFERYRVRHKYLNEEELGYQRGIF